MRFRARLIQEFTIIADDEEAARYAAVHRISRFADMGGIDEKLGRWKARAHDPVLDSLVAEAPGANGDTAAIGGADQGVMPQGRDWKANANGIGEGQLQFGGLLDYGYPSGGSDSSADEVGLEIF